MGTPVVGKWADLHVKGVHEDGLPRGVVIRDGPAASSQVCHHSVVC